MRVTGLTCLFGILILLNACNGKSFEGHLVPDNDVARPENAGYLVGSIGYYRDGPNKSAAKSNSVMFRSVGGEDSGAIVARRGFIESGDYEEGDRVGKVFALPLRPGTYEFHNVEFWLYYGTAGSKTYTRNEDFSVSFTIEEGKAYYAGEFMALGIYGRSTLAMTMPVGGYFVHGSDLARDGRLLLKKYPELRDKAIEPLDLRFDFPWFIVTRLR